MAPPCRAGETGRVDLRETWRARADTWIRWSRSPDLAGTYASERRYTVETPEKARLAMTYEGLHRPLTAYTAALAASGLVIEAIREPVKTDGDSVTMPFLDLLARRPPA